MTHKCEIYKANTITLGKPPRYILPRAIHINCRCKIEEILKE